MKLGKCLALAALLGAVSPQLGYAQTTIDTNSTWDGNINFGWYGSGQSITVPITFNVFDFITVYADEEASGQYFDFKIADALSGGNTLFSQNNVLIGTGANTFNVNQAFTSGNQIWALFDYNGYSGNALHFSYTNSYAGGSSNFYNGEGQTNWPTLDHRFIAQFSGGRTSVPDSGVTLSLLALSMIGLAAFRRRFAA